MAKKRTKKQKKRTAARKSHSPMLQPKVLVRKEALSATLPEKTIKFAGQKTNTTKWLIDDQAVKKDLLKSLLVTCFLLILLFGMYWYLR